MLVCVNGNLFQFIREPRVAKQLEEALKLYQTTIENNYIASDTATPSPQPRYKGAMLSSVVGKRAAALHLDHTTHYIQTTHATLCSHFF